MAHLLANDFTSYSLSDEEEIQGSIFTIGQKQVLQNMLAAAAQEKIALVYDAKEPTFFTQQEASLKGQMDVLRHLLEVSDAAEASLIPTQEDYTDPLGS